MGGVIDFSTSCPWQMYTFSFLHILISIVFYAVDLCPFAFPKSNSCSESDLVMQRITALSTLYVGVLFSVLTYHNKNSAGKINRLCTYAVCAATAFFVSVIFAGNASSYGGIERSWMHIGDMICSLLLVCIVGSRVDLAHEWADANDDAMQGLGINCKTLILLFLIICTVKLFGLTDVVGPTYFLADGLDMTDVSLWMWNFTSVLLFDIILVLIYALYFEDNQGHELVVMTVTAMSLVAAVSFGSISGFMSAIVNGKVLWIRVSILVVLSVAAVVGGRQSGSNRTGYQSV